MPLVPAARQRRFHVFLRELDGRTRVIIVSDGRETIGSFWSDHRLTATWGSRVLNNHDTLQGAGVPPGATIILTGGLPGGG
eukprot:10380777-Heterocapsa_arctica.AAC.1